MVCCASCKKKIFGCTDPSAFNYNASANESDGSCDYEGDISFWTNSGVFGNIDISVDGTYIGTTAFYFPSGTPQCKQSGTVSVTLTKGVHNYFAATTTGSYTWSGTFTVDSECSTFELY